MNKKRWIIASVLVVILGLCIVLGMGLSKNDTKQEDDKNESQEFILDEKDKSEQGEDKVSSADEKGTTSSQTNTGISGNEQTSANQNSGESNSNEEQKTPVEDKEDNWELPYIPIE
jgi:cytoskeletal protein RodZ